MDSLKLIEEAKLCSCTIAWIIPQDSMNEVVQAFKKACPTIQHRITMDWDDDTLLWLRFTWEKGAWDPPRKIPVSAPIQVTRPQSALNKRW